MYAFDLFSIIRNRESCPMIMSQYISCERQLEALCINIFARNKIIYTHIISYVYIYCAFVIYDDDDEKIVARNSIRRDISSFRQRRAREEPSSRTFKRIQDDG